MTHIIRDFSATKTNRRDALPATIRWLPAPKKERIEPVDRKLLDAELYLAQKIRTGNRYPHQRNYHGLYYFSQTGKHVWHESLLEANALRWLDMHEDIVAIAAQPFELRFADGNTHTPDFIALHSDHRQTVVDVKPTKRISSEKFQAQAAKTRAVCDRVGWGYEVHGDLADQVRINLAWVAAFKHHGYYPGTEASKKLLSAMTAPIPLVRAARLLDLPLLPAARAGIYNLIWTRHLHIDLALPLNDSTLVERTHTNVHA